MLKYIVGIDAGGMHSATIAYDENGRELGHAESGPGQINNDYKPGIKNIAQAANELHDRIGGDRIRVLAGIAGLSVVGNVPEVAAAISSMVGNVPARTTADSLLTLYNGLEGVDGALVIAGTGSVVNDRQDGSLVAVGGHGSLFGDEGSGHAIVKAALRLAPLSRDKRKKNSLIDLFVREFSVDNVEEVPTKFYSLTSPEVASKAVKVAKLAGSDDKDTRKIIADQAHLLTRGIIMCLDRYEDPKPMRTALTGSVLSNNAMMHFYAEAEIKEKHPDAVFSILSGKDARGVTPDKSEDYRYLTNYNDDE